MESTSLKELGNQEFRAKNYQKAIDLYTQALETTDSGDISAHIVYSNRSAAYIKI